MQEFCFRIALNTARFNLNLITFRETYNIEFFIIFFVYSGRFVSSKDRGLYLYMNDIRDRNVNLPIQGVSQLLKQSDWAQIQDFK